MDCGFYAFNRESEERRQEGAEEREKKKITHTKYETVDLLWFLHRACWIVVINMVDINGVTALL